MSFSPRLLSLLERLDSVCVLTGAGISAESGVPTFRGSEGLWSKFKPEELANFEAFIRNPQLVWEWYRYRRKLLEDVRPNAAHEALVELEKKVREFMLVTQNVDNLHQRAGNKRVLELHGNIERSYCLDCGKFADRGFDKVEEVPRCRYCGGLLRPDVVWFGELLPEGVFQEAEKAAERAELFLCIGTSGVVYPAASLPVTARRAGSYVVEINTESTDLSPKVDESLRAKAGEIVPELVNHIQYSGNFHP